MAVQQNRKSRSRRDMRRSHDRITINAVAVDATLVKNTSVTMRPKTVFTVVVNYSK